MSQPNVVSPRQAVWLDADEGGVKAAEGAGMKAVLVKNVDEVLEKLSGFTGIQVLKVRGYFSNPLLPTPPPPSHDKSWKRL